MYDKNLNYSITKTGLILTFIVSTLLFLVKACFIHQKNIYEISLLFLLSVSSFTGIFLIKKNKFLKFIQVLIYTEITLLSILASYLLHNKLMLLWLYLAMLSAFIIVGKKFGTVMAVFIFLFINVYYFLGKLTPTDYWILAPSLIVFAIFSYISISTSENYSKKIHNMAEKDYLTDIYNRRAFFEKIKNTVTPTETNGVLMLDIDHFKKINDTYGHETGDMVLKTFTQRISSILRKSDIFARIGGEEFAIFIQNINKENLEKKAKQINSIIKNNKTENIRVTVSIGGYVFKDKSINEALKKADEALYEAKKTRDAVVIKGD